MGRANKLTFWRRLYLCNDSQASEQIFTNGNALSVGDDGYALLAPFGDSRYSIPTKEGVKVVIQRITKENATEMVNAFNSLVGKVHRWIKGAPIFLGHPDDSVTGHRYPVKEPMGMFSDLQVRENGLYVRPMFNEKGAQVLERPDKVFFSGRWPVKHTGEKDGMPVFEPTSVTSIGITRNPNLPTEMLNETPNIMDKSKLVALLATFASTLSNESTDEQILAELKKIGDAKTALDLQLANERHAKEAAEKKAKEVEEAFTNERKTQAAELIASKLTEGAITAAEKALWEKRLETNFVNEAPALRELKPKIKTSPNPAADGSRSRLPQANNEAGAKLIQFANAKLEEVRKANPNGSKSDHWREAYAAAEKENPALVEQLNHKE